MLFLEHSLSYVSGKQRQSSGFAFGDSKKRLSRIACDGNSLSSVRAPHIKMRRRIPPSANWWWCVVRAVEWPPPVDEVPVYCEDVEQVEDELKTKQLNW